MSYKPIFVKTTPEMVKLAAERDHGKYNDRSFMGGKGNIVGFLGEYITLAVRPDFKHVDTFDYDMLMGEKGVDVKTKYQSIRIPPPEYYEASIDINSLHQRTDYYIFCRMYKDKDIFPWGWVLGGISKPDYLAKARRLYKGDIDGDNGFKVRQDCLNLPYGELKPIRDNR